MKRIFTIVFFSLIFSNKAQIYSPGSGVTDIDGNSYQTVIINGQEWMSENLRTSKYANGDPIPNVTNSNQWINLTSGAWSHYNNNSQLENPYGKHYNWFAAADPRNVCPTGWHVPDYQEWGFLLWLLGGDLAGGKLKSTGTIESGTGLWNQPNLGADNSSGLNILPAGLLQDGVWELMGGWTGLWTSTIEVVENLSTEMYFVELNNLNANVEIYLTDGYNGLSIRCLKNNISSEINENSMDDFSIYPNPTTNSITIKGEKNMNQSFQIFDQMGREVFKGKLNGITTEVNLSILSKGIYTLKIEGNYKPVQIVKE